MKAAPSPAAGKKTRPKPARTGKAAAPKRRPADRSNRQLPGLTGPHSFVNLGEDEVLVLGTAHVSRSSVEDVEVAIARYRPDTVCVELCRPRHEALLDPDRWKGMDLSRVIKEKKLALLASNLILSSFQKKMGERSGVRPGEEMLRASEISRKSGIELVLADREIRTTLSRAWAKVGFFSRVWLASYLGTSLLVREEISPEQIEELKQKDVLEDLFSALPPRYREVKEVILDERDAYLAENIRRAAVNHADLERHAPEPPYDVALFARGSSRRGKQKKRILAVVGAGHLPGIVRTLKEVRPVDLAALQQIPPGNPLRSVLLWMGVSVMLFLVGAYLAMGGKDAAMEMFWAWVIARSMGAGVGAILSLAHPLTILTTIVMAPLVPVIPGARLFMFSGLVEVWARKPRVEDFENIAGDTDTPGGFFRSLFRNRVLHLLFVTFAVSTGLTIGNLTFLQRVVAGLLRATGWL